MENKKIRKVDNSLLSLEKKLDKGSTNEIILNKFKLKPEFDLGEISKAKDYKNKLNSFLSEFKKSTEELLNNPEMIEAKKIEDVTEKKNDDSSLPKENKFIKMDLALGVLDLKQKQENENLDKGDNLLNNIIQQKSNNLDIDHPILNQQGDSEILKFLMSNSKKPKRPKQRRRIHLIKNK
jgi:hypothetical protein